MVSDELQAVIRSLHSPALLLSQSRMILAVNDAVCRLTGELSHESLIDRNVQELGFELASDGQFCHQDWDSLFQACVSDQAKPVISRESKYGSSNDKPCESRAKDFWDDEDRREAAISDVVVTELRSKSVPVRARMIMRPLQLEDGSFYVVVFQRPSARTQFDDDGHARKDTNAGEADLQLSRSDLKEREAQVHNLVSTNIPYFTAIFDSEGKAVHLSLSWQRVTDMKQKDSLGTGWFQAIHPDDRQSMRNAFDKMVKVGDNSWTWEARYRNKHGTYKWFLVRLEPAKDDTGSIKYWYGSMMDVDALLTSRQASENRRKSIMALVSKTNVCLWGLNTDRSLLLQEGSLHWDPMAALDIRSRRSSIADPDASTSSDRVFDSIQDILDGRTNIQILEHKEQDRWYRSTLIADLQGHIPHQTTSQIVQAVLGLTFDITDVRARTELEVQNEILVQKERAAKEASELKSRFVANISHELRTPIAGIIGMNDLLIESLVNQEQRYFSNSIRSSAAQLLTVVNDVLDLSKIEAGRLEIEALPFRVCRLVENIQSIMTIQAERKGLEFVCRNVDIPQAAVVIGDPNRLQQVFLNLLSNSIKFTQTGRVTLDASLVPSTKAAKEIISQSSVHINPTSQSSKSSDDEAQMIQVHFVVEDTGCGMTDATIEKIFEAFSQADSSTARQYGGTGLGLTITRQLVELMNGSITFSSTPDVGTRAVVTMSFKEASQEDEEIDLDVLDQSHALATDAKHITKAYTSLDDTKRLPTRQTSARRGSQDQGHALSTVSMTERNKKLILIVEDNAVNLKIATVMTERLGFQVITASNGEEALNLLAERVGSLLPCPDIILMDCMMPIMDGYEATRRLRQDISRFPASSRGTPIIALTASAHKGDMERCLEAGMNDYLIKPVNKKKLEQALVQWTLKAQQRLAPIGELQDSRAET
ncbi:hypothetical protein LTR64_008691 [Lithohypha guttulata]|uniref:uncharacterized protein n=1 Tax=Lithohypha guttulata TaxID=1690604 RepID=UPI002DE1C6FA|nr:hypothetical protein LTR51_008702 [Lithohypha guttulata]